MNHKVKRLNRTLVAALFVTALPISMPAQNTLINGKKITLPPVGTLTRPLAGTIAYDNFTPNLGSHPANLVSSPDGKFAVATDLGYRQYLSVISTATGQLVSQVGFGAAHVSSWHGLFYGLAFAPTLNQNGTYTLYAAQGNNNTIAILQLNATSGALSVVTIGGTPSIIMCLTNYDFPAGLAISANGKYLYVANHQAKTANNAGSLSIFTTLGGGAGRPLRFHRRQWAERRRHRAGWHRFQLSLRHRGVAGRLKGLRNGVRQRICLLHQCEQPRRAPTRRRDPHGLTSGWSARERQHGIRRQRPF